MTTLQTKHTKAETMSENELLVQKIREEFADFQRTMEELKLLKRIAQDLKNYREMIKLKKYD
jgi:hypothetical protein